MTYTADNPLKVLSLGAGVQSSTLLRMMIRGDFGPEHKPHHAIFADVGWEPQAVYDQVEVLRKESEAAGIQFHVVQYGNLREDMIKGWVPNDSSLIGHAFGSIPVFIKGEKGEGMLRRQCTEKYKIAPVNKRIRELLGVKSFGHTPPGSVWYYFGISSDETRRMRTSNLKALRFYYPLIMKNSTTDKVIEWRRPGIRRADCLKWNADHGFTEPPRSACLGCPYHTNAEWRRIKADPVQWKDAVEFDRAIRHPVRLEGESFLHRDRVPLDEADLNEPDPAQMEIECEGYCGN